MNIYDVKIVQNKRPQSESWRLVVMVIILALCVASNFHLKLINPGDDIYT